jgi:hypothetical protein
LEELGCGRETDHGFVPSEAAGQAQVLFVGMQDVGLVSEVRLGAVSRSDPPPLA